MDECAASQYALAHAASGLKSRVPMSAHPPGSAAAISTTSAMLPLAAQRRLAVLVLAASGCDAVLHASGYHAADASHPIESAALSASCWTSTADCDKFVWSYLVLTAPQPHTKRRGQ